MADDAGADANINPTQLLPKRNPGLIQRIARAVIKNDPGLGPQPQQQQSTQSGAIAVADRQSIFETYFDTQNDRLAVYADADEMDSMSEEASVALDTIADNACTSEDGTMASFDIYTQDDRIKEILGDVVRVTDLHHKAYSMARNAVKYGDVFLEIVANGQGDVVDIRQLPPKTMQRNEDNNGNLKMDRPQYNPDGSCSNSKGQCAYVQLDPNNQTVYAAFYPWQISHGRWNHDGFSRYGRSYLRVSRIIWKKLHAEEEALIMGRLVRAMLKLAFYIDTTGQSKSQKIATLTDFQDKILSRTTTDGKREKPFSVLTDFFLAVEHIRMGGQTVESKTRIESIDPKNDGLTHIDDIKHFHRKFLATLRVPPAYMGFEDHAGSKGTVSMQDIQFIRFLRRLQQFLGQVLRQAFDTALVLQGIDPHTAEYEVRWPPLSTADEAAAADAFYKQAQGWALLLGTNSLNQTPVIDPEYVQKYGLELSDEEIAEMNSRIDAQEEEALQKQQATMDMQQKQQIELLSQKAKLTPKPVVVPPSQRPGETNAPQIHDHTAKNDPAKVANGSDTSVRQENAGEAVRLLLAKASSRVEDDFMRLESEQRTALSLADSLPVRNGNGHHHPAVEQSGGGEIATALGLVAEAIHRPVEPPTVTIAEGAIQIHSTAPEAPPGDAEIEYDEDGRISGVKRKKRYE